MTPANETKEAEIPIDDDEIARMLAKQCFGRGSHEMRFIARIRADAGRLEDLEGQLGEVKAASARFQEIWDESCKLMGSMPDSADEDAKALYAYMLQKLYEIKSANLGQHLLDRLAAAERLAEAVEALPQSAGNPLTPDCNCCSCRTKRDMQTALAAYHAAAKPDTRAGA